MRKYLLLLALFFLPLSPITHAAEPYRELKWEDLVPKDWDPAADLKNMNLGKLQDGDPKADDALAKIREMWNNAPTEPKLAGARVRLPGFAIPLEKSGEKVSEFLIVPYFGACIHSPPPPANQIIHVVTKKPLAKLRSMDAVWVRGTLALHHADTPWGAAGYRLTLDDLMPYEEPKKK